MRFVFDIVAQDSQGRDVLFVEVKTRHLDDDTARALLDSLRKESPGVRFGMLADLEQVRIVDFEHDPGKHGFTAVLPTPEVLRTYDPEFGAKRVFANYLATLVDAWLSDLAFHWKLEAPPGADRLAAIGLLELLEDGDTRREALSGADPVRRD